MGLDMTSNLSDMYLVREVRIVYIYITYDSSYGDDVKCTNVGHARDYTQAYTLLR